MAAGVRKGLHHDREDDHVICGARQADAQWGKDLRPYFAYRDLGIKDATDGRVLAHIIRAEQPCDGPLGYHSHALDFQMVYLISGWARLYFEDIGEIRVEAGDAWYQPPGSQA